MTRSHRIMRRARAMLAIHDARLDEFSEELHPRAPDGKFGEGSGGTAEKSSNGKTGSSDGPHPHASIEEHHRHVEKTAARLRDARLAMKDAIDDMNHDQASKHAKEIRSIADEVNKASKTLDSKIKATTAPSNTELALQSSAQRSAREAGGMVHEAEDKLEMLQLTPRGHGRMPPEPGALKSGEYRKLTTDYAKTLDVNQRGAVSNYSNHTDKILNPMLRASEGKPDAEHALYSGSHAPANVHEIRQAKRHPEMTSSSTVGGEMAALDSAISKHSLDRDVKVYRTLNDPGGKLFGSIDVGDTFQDHAYVSTTADRNLLDRFFNQTNQGNDADRVDMHITLKKGAKAAPMESMSSYEGEREMLLGRGSRFRITKVVPAEDGYPKEVHAELTED